MATHSSTLAWKIPWMEEPGRLQSTGSRRVGHDWATSLSLSCIGEGNGNPLQCSCLENPRDGGAWCAAVYGIAQSWTRLKQLSSSMHWEKWIFLPFQVVSCWLFKWHICLKTKNVTFYQLDWGLKKQLVIEQSWDKSISMRIEKNCGYFSMFIIHDGIRHS